MLRYQAPAEEVEAIRDWFAAWHGHVEAVNFTAARTLFDDDVIGFGTFMDTVSGLDSLEQRQWRAIWPAIEGFHFNLDTLRVGVSKDGCLAFGVVTWDSTGFHKDGGRYPRPGRATVLFGRAGRGEPWKGLHTHISLNPGTPQSSHGARPETH
jgi:ketosteroid isomerase-like protein